MKPKTKKPLTPLQRQFLSLDPVAREVIREGLKRAIDVWDGKGRGRLTGQPFYMRGNNSPPTKEKHHG